MNLVWKLLRQHISVPQFLGFSFANLFGMFIVLLGIQFYCDIVPVFTAEDSFMRADYLIMNKKIGTANTISGSSNTFSTADIADVKAQPFARRVGEFTSTAYKVNASMGINGTNVLNSEIPIEAVPDAFVDAPLASWHWHEGDNVVPIILPRAYITMYNFGFAQNHSLPKLSDGLIGMIDFKIFIQGNGRHGAYNGRVIGFSSRLNTILVPQSFMDWSNRFFAPGNQQEPARLIMDVTNPSDVHIGKYLDRKGYEIEDTQLNAEKTTYFLRMLVTMVMGVGLVISLLSFYILMLSIYLLVQKNSSKLENLLLIGYSPSGVSYPYQLLTIGLNLLVLLLAWFILFFVRGSYMDFVITLFPQLEEGTMFPSFLVGIVLFVLVSVLNIIAIRRKITHIWQRKD